MTGWMDGLLYGDQGFGASSMQVVFTLLLGLLLGQIVGWIYMWTHTSLSYSRSFASSLVVLPVIVSLMMILMSGSLMIAFGLLAVFAVVRFRNVLKDTRDTTYILWAIVEGMAAGTFHYRTSLLGVVVIAFVLLYLRLTDFGGRHRFDAMLSLEFSSERKSTMDRLKLILAKHTTQAVLMNERRLEPSGSLLNYRISLRDADRFDELRAELSAAVDVHDVTLYLQKQDPEV